MATATPRRSATLACERASGRQVTGRSIAHHDAAPTAGTLHLGAARPSTTDQQRPPPVHRSGQLTVSDASPGFRGAEIEETRSIRSVLRAGAGTSSPTGSPLLCLPPSVQRLRRVQSVGNANQASARFGLIPVARRPACRPRLLDDHFYGAALERQRAGRGRGGGCGRGMESARRRRRNGHRAGRPARLRAGCRHGERVAR